MRARVCVCVCARVRVCVCVCVRACVGACARARKYTYVSRLCMASDYQELDELETGSIVVDT